MMKSFLIKFITLDGNKQEVFICEINDRRAINKFETEYEFETILECELLD